MRARQQVAPPAQDAPRAGCIVFLNRASARPFGPSRGETALRVAVRDAFAGAGLSVDPILVSGEELDAAVRRVLDLGPDVVVAGGGDGTMSTVAERLAGTDTALGILPLGTLNHFAKDLGIPLDLADAARAIVAGRRAQIDMGEVNGRLFLNNASLGIYPALVSQREQHQARGYRKWTASAIAAWTMWRRYRRVRVAIHTGSELRVIHTPFVFVGNNAYDFTARRPGGRCRLDEGMLHLAVAPGMSRKSMARALAMALAGRFSPDQHLDTWFAPRLAVSAWRRSVRVALDGELVRLTTPLQFRIRPSLLRVCVPGSVDATTRDMVG